MRVGVSSFTYPWAVGVPGHTPPRAFGLWELLDQACSLGVAVLQIGDNIPLHRVSDPELDRFSARARELGISVEVGMRGLDPARVATYAALAQRFRSPILRLVTGGRRGACSPDQVVDALLPHRHLFQRAELRLAIENYEAFRTDEFVYIVERLGVDWAGICLDTVNSLGLLQSTQEVVATLAPYTINLHVKDVLVQRAEHALGFAVVGAPVGAGILDVPWLVSYLDGYSPQISAIIELWTPPGASTEETIQVERDWAEISVRYLQSILGASGRQADA